MEIKPQSTIKKSQHGFIQNSQREKCPTNSVNHFSLLPSIESLPLIPSLWLHFSSAMPLFMLVICWMWNQTTKMLNSEIYFVTVKTWLMIFRILMATVSLYSVLNSWASLKWKISVHFLTISKLECLFIRNVSVPYYLVSKDEMCLTINKTFICLTKIPIFIEA